MVFTLVGYSQSLDTAGVLTALDGLPDQHVRVELKNIIVPREMNHLAGALAVGATITGAQLESPTLRRTVLLDLAPINVGVEPVSPTPLARLFGIPIPLDEDEALRALAAEGAAGAERETVVVWLADGPLSPVDGEVYTVRATGTTTLVGYAWTNVPLTFAQVLPAGRYQVVGMRAESAGCIAARCVFVGGVWRPGCVGYDAIGDHEDVIFRRGMLGVWGEFSHTQPPSVEFLSISTDTAEVVYLDVIRIA